MLLIASICGLGFAYFNIKKISKLDSIQIYGDLSSEITKLALNIRASDHSYFYKLPFYFPLENIKKNIETLKTLKQRLRSNKEELSFCSNFKIYSNYLMPEKYLKYKQINLKNYIDKTINQVFPI